MAHITVPIIYCAPDGCNSVMGYKTKTFTLESTLYDIFEWVLKLRADVGVYAIIGDMVISNQLAQGGE